MLEREKLIVKMYKQYKRWNPDSGLWWLWIAVALIGGMKISSVAMEIAVPELAGNQWITSAIGLMAGALVLCLRNRMPEEGELRKVVSEQEEEIARKFGVETCSMDVEKRKYYLVVNSEDNMTVENAGMIYNNWLDETAKLGAEWVVLVIKMLVPLAICTLLAIIMSGWIGLSFWIAELILSMILWWQDSHVMLRAYNEINRKAEAALNEKFLGEIENKRPELGEIGIFGWGLKSSNPEELSDQMKWQMKKELFAKRSGVSFVPEADGIKRIELFSGNMVAF